MATSVVTPAPSGPVGDPAPPSAPSSNALIDSVFSGVPSSDATDPAATPAPDTSVPGPAATPDPQTPPDPGVAPTDPAAAQQAPAPEKLKIEDVDFGADPIQPDSVSQDGNRLFFNKAKGRQLLAAGEFVQELKQMLPGMTLDTMRDVVKRASAAEMMLTRFNEGVSDPEAMNDVLEVFTRENPQAFSKMALQALGQLPKVDPSAFQRVLNVHNNYVIRNLRTRAQQTVDPPGTDPKRGPRGQAIALALQTEMALTGRFTPSAEWLSGQKTSDPMQEERQRFEAERQAFAEQQRRHQEAQQQNWAMSAGQRMQNSIEGEIESFIPTNLKTALKNSPRRYSALKNDLHNAIAEAERSNEDWTDRYNILYKQAALSGSQGDLDALAQFRASVAKTVLRRNGAAILNEHGNGVLSTNQAAHQQAGSRPPNEPSPLGATPSAANGINIDAALKSRTYKDVFEAVGF